MCGSKRSWTAAPPAPPLSALSVFQQEVLGVLNKDICEEEHFLLSLAPALKRLDNRIKGLARMKSQQVLYDIDFAD